MVKNWSVPSLKEVVALLKAELRQAKAQLDGKAHRHIQGEVCIACIPLEVKKMLAAESALTDARAELSTQYEEFACRSDDYHRSLRAVAKDRDTARTARGRAEIALSDVRAELKAEKERRR